MRAASSRNGAELFGRALAVLRISRGMSRNELASAAGVGPSNLSNYERGRARPREETLERILEALKLPPAALERAQDFARHPMGRDGTLPPHEHASGPATSRKAALKLAQEVGKAFAHVTLAFLELQAGGWEEQCHGE
jgi:transcriptional regulator with XRE-family HTH domain